MSFAVKQTHLLDKQLDDSPLGLACDWLLQPPAALRLVPAAALLLGLVSSSSVLTTSLKSGLHGVLRGNAYC